MKYVVIVGPNLKTHDSQVLDVIEQTIKKYFIHVIHEELIIPEANIGAQYVRGVVSKLVKDNIPTLFVTRYGDIMNQLSEEIEQGNIDSKDVLIKLVRYDFEDISKFYVTEHMIGDDQITNNWPIGILW